MDSEELKLLKEAEEGKYDRGRTARTVTPILKLALLIKYDYKCAKCFYGMGPGNIFEIHHIIPWADGGETNFKNLIPLCKDCHKEAPNNPDGLKEYLKFPYPPNLERTTRGFIEGMYYALELNAEEQLKAQSEGSYQYFFKYINSDFHKEYVRARKQKELEGNLI